MSLKIVQSFFIPRIREDKFPDEWLLKNVVGKVIILAIVALSTLRLSLVPILASRIPLEIEINFDENTIPISKKENGINIFIFSEGTTLLNNKLLIYG